MQNPKTVTVNETAPATASPVTEEFTDPAMEVMSESEPEDDLPF